MAKKTKAELEQELYEAEKEKSRLNKMIKQLLDDQEATKKDYSELYMLYEETKESEEYWLEIAEKTKAKNTHLQDLVEERDNYIEGMYEAQGELATKIEAKDAELEELYKYADQQKQDLESIIDHWKRSAEEEGQKNKELRQELKSTHDNLIKSVETIEELREKFSKACEVNDEYLNQLETLEDSIEENLKDTENMIETAKTLERDACELEMGQLREANQSLTDIANQAQREKLEALEDLMSVKGMYAEQHEELEITVKDQKSDIEALTKAIQQVQIEKEDALYHVEQLDSQLSEYMREVNNLKNELKIKTTSLEYIENGLRSSEKEVMKVRKVNKNLLNYIEILASQDSPNLPDEFTY